MGDVVVGEMNDVFTGDTVRHHKLDSVMGVRLMTVVAVGVGTSHYDGPVGVSGGRKGSESSGSDESFHFEGEVFVSIQRIIIYRVSNLDIQACD